MKKLLTIIFMAALTVSVFATVNTETETPTVNHDGSCERVGSMRFIVTNDQDYQSATTTDPIIVRIQLTDGAVLCHDLDGVDDLVPSDANNYWVELETDSFGYWPTGNTGVLARGQKGSNFIEVIIRSAPNNGGTLPNPAQQAWFRLGSTVLINGAPYVGPNLYNPGTFTSAGNKTLDGVPICVDYSAHPGGVDQFPQNNFNVISLTTWQFGSQLGVSYSPANPAIAYGGDDNGQNFNVRSDCGKNSVDLASDDVLLCQCYVPTTVQNDDGSYTTTYDCKDLYRVGTLVLDTNACDVWIEESTIGMVPSGSTITMTVVDASGAPIDVYFASVPTLTQMAPSELTVGAPVAGAAVTHTYSVYNNTAGFVPDDGVCDTSGKDQCYDNYNLYESYSWTVTGESVTEAGKLQLSDVDLARLTSDGPITAYLKISWSPIPCGSGGSKILLDYPLNFVNCPPEAAAVVKWYPTYEYFTYFPAVNAQWWAGLAVTNVSYYNENFVNVGGVTDQDADVVLYLIEADGDVYMYNAGTLPKSGILVTLLSDPSFSPTLMSGYTDSTFGDEAFWVIAKATPTIGNSVMSIDGFGMLGDGNQGQGTLPRIDWGWFTGFPVNVKK
jgi:hypothetical protein